jgi:tRNA pseudouridine55 synthase
MSDRTPASGVLVVGKDAGRTSFDVVAIVRRRLGLRRVGHAGTLDPAALGVLPILLGEATKLMPYLADQDKVYRVTVRFGLRTDTQDLTGRVLSESTALGFGRAEIEAALPRFVGTIRQVPPMYSAVHRDGRRLYELAREGVEVEREPRTVTVRSIDVAGVDLPDAVMTVVCGKGTYVRTLVADLGDLLGCGAVVAHLVRLRVGPFGLDEALPVADLAALPAAAVWASVRPPEAALASWPVVTLDAASTRSFLHGQQAHARRAPDPPAPRVVVRGDDGRFLGVGAMVGTTAGVRPERILHADHPGSQRLRA